MDFLPSQHDFFGFLHVDLNSFFASVEQELHPEYRNRPLAVVPTFANTTVAIAASYEAKALGIKTGTRVGDMKQICPEILLVQGDHTTYAEFSHRIHAAVERCCPVAHIPSIDEVTCQLIGREQDPPRAREIALSIKEAIRNDVGETLRCSIGMAPNRYLAKIASDMQKPDGLIGLLPSQLPRSLAHLELRDLPGVGARTELMLNRKGITTMPQLLALSRDEMHRLWNSVWGDRLYHWLRGHATGDNGAPVPREIQQSLGHSHVLAPDHRTPEGAWAVAHKLLHKASMRLRMEHFCAGTLTLTIRYQVTPGQLGRSSSQLQKDQPDRSAFQPQKDQPGRGEQSQPGRSGFQPQNGSAYPGEPGTFTPTQNVSFRPENEQFHRSSAAEKPASPSVREDARAPARPYTVHGRSGASAPEVATYPHQETTTSAPEAPHPKLQQQPALKQHHSGIRHHNWGMEAKFPASQDTLSLLETLRELWRQQPTGPAYDRPFFVGVTLSRLSDEAAQQPGLFRDTTHRNELSRALDKLNLKHGHTTVHFAGMLPARDSAPTRIAFTQIPVQYGVDYM